MKQRFTFQWIWILLLLGAALTGCGPGGAETPPVETTATGPELGPTAISSAPAQGLTPTPAGLQGTVTIWHSWDEARVPLLVQIIDGFRAENPQVHFDVLYVPPEDLRRRYETTVREGWGPALLLGPADWGPGLLQAGLISSLDALAPAALLDRLNSAGVEALRLPAGLAGLPYRLEGVVLYRNPSLVLEAPTTFESWVQLARGAHQGETVGAVLDPSFRYSGAHLYGLGGQLIQPDGLPAFNNELGDAWLELLAAYQRIGPLEFQNDNDLNHFKNGQAGFIIDGTWNMASLLEAMGDRNVAIDPWPSYGNGYLSGFVQADALFLNPLSAEADRQAAWEFMVYFLSDPVQTALAQAGDVPAVTDLFVENSLILEAMEALEGGTAYPVLPEFEVYPPVMEAAIRAHLSEGVDAQTALQTAENDIIQRLSERVPTPEP